MHRIAATTTLLLLGGGAYAEDLVWIKDGKHAATHEIPAGKFVEVCANIAPGERYRWKFDASGKVNFDVHYHVGELVGRPAAIENVQEAGSVLEVKSKQDYCWTWQNRSKEPVKVNADISRIANPT